MKINKNKIETFWAIFLTLIVVSLFIILPIYNKYTLKKDINIIKKGKKTICFVYKASAGINGSPTASYYFFSKKQVNDFYTYNYPQIQPRYKFYFVYFLLNDNKSSVVDFSHEIPIDSVQYYFPKGQNPFKEEIEAIKEGRYKVSDWF